MVIIGIGTEIVECVRIAKMIEQHGELFLQRVYTVDEIHYCSQRAAATQHYAARWVAKEAVLKALSTGRSTGIRWTDIEVYHDPLHGDAILLHGEARRQGERHGIDQVLISLGHCRTHATATAIAVAGD